MANSFIDKAHTTVHTDSGSVSSSHCKKRYPVDEAMHRAPNSKYDIGVMGSTCAPNYGSHLTNYALYQFLTDSGYDVLILRCIQGRLPLNNPELFVETPYPVLSPYSEHTFFYP